MRELKIEQGITGRDSTSLQKYMNDISKISLLTGEEEMSLTKRIRAGDEQALEKLIKTNLRFVVSVAKHYQHRGLSLGDLINEGNLGLIKAANRFDETRGFKFITFAVWWIRQSITLALSEQTRVVRLPLNIVSAVTKINKTVDVLEQRHQRLPTVEELAMEIGFNKEKVLDYMEKAKIAISLNATLSSEYGGTLMDVIHSGTQPTDHLLIIPSQLDEINELLYKIPKREALVIRMYYGIATEAVSLEEIAFCLKLSKERIRQIKDSGIRKLKTKIKTPIQEKNDD